MEQLRLGNNNCLDKLIEHYYYIALKYSSKYDDDIKEKVLKKALELLKSSLIDYSKRKEEDKKGLSHFIHNRFRYFNNYIEKENIKKNNIKKDLKPKEKLIDLEQLAYNKNINARVIILNRNKELIERKAQFLYNNYMKKVIIEMEKNKDYSYLDENFVFPDNLIEYDDIIQDYYLRSWIFLNEFFDNQKNKVEKKFFNQYLANSLNHYNEANLKKLQNYNFNDILSYGYNDFSYIFEDKLNELEIDDILDNLSNYLNGNMKETLSLIRKGHSYSSAAKILNVSRTLTQQLNSRVLEIAKRKNIL